MCTSPRRQLILEFMSNDLEGLKALRYCSTVQSRFSDIKISDNLGFSGYFFNLLQKIIRFSDMRFSGSFCGDQKCH